MRIKPVSTEVSRGWLRALSIVGPLAGLAATAERERLRTTLRDNVIQRVFAIRLELEGAEEELPASATAASAGIEHAIDQLGLVMEEIRLAIVGQGGAPANGVDGAEDSGGSAWQRSG
jgi:hypothetical protein